MFIGHYSAAFALKSIEKEAPLGGLAIAVQFIDVLFFPLVLFGIERMNIVPHYTEASPLELVWMPYTHSLLGALFWSVAVSVAWAFLAPRSAARRRVAVIMGIAVFSHWILDLAVHTPDLSLWGGDSPKVGFGIWRNALATSVIEAGLLLASVYAYMRATKPVSTVGRYAVVIFALVLIGANAINIYGPPPTSVPATAATGLAAYFVFAAIAWWIDRLRN
jgi:hypothetical protein